MKKRIYCIVDVVGEEAIEVFLSNNDESSKLAFDHVCKQNSVDGLQLNLYFIKEVEVSRIDEKNLLFDLTQEEKLISSYPSNMEKRIEKIVKEELNEHLQ